MQRPRADGSAPDRVKLFTGTPRANEPGPDVQTGAEGADDGGTSPPPPAFKLCYVEDFPIASAAVQAAMDAVRAGLGTQEARPLREGLCTCNFHGTMAGPAPGGDVVLSLFYDVPLGSAWEQAAEALRLGLGLVGIVGRSKGCRVVCGKDHVVETLTLGSGKQLKYAQVEGHFSNPNSHIAALTVDWLCSESARSMPAGSGDTSDLLELYCGNGNHTMALSTCGAFRKIVGIEINSRLVEMAQLNIAMNNVGDNCVIARAPAAKAVTKILHRHKPGQKGRHGNGARNGAGAGAGAGAGNGAGNGGGGGGEGGALTEEPPANTTHFVFGQPYAFRAILVDPPRAGLDDPTRRHVKRYKDILYISCAPAALRRDLGHLINKTIK